MPRRCCIWGCRSNFDPGKYVNVFSFPRNPEMRQLWISAIPYGHTLKVTDCTVVCKYHFDPDSIIYEDLVLNSNGTLTSVRRKHPKLKKGTLPSIFTNFGPHCDGQLQQPKNINDSGFFEENVVPILDMSCTNEEDEEQFSSGREDISNNSDGSGEISSEVKKVHSCNYCSRVAASVISRGARRFCSYQCYSLATSSSRRSVAKASAVSSSCVANEIDSESDTKLSFSWDAYLNKPDFIAAPVSSFKHVPLADCWDDNIVVGMKVEAVNMDSKGEGCAFYWIASVIKILGYYVSLRYEGFSDDSRDFWVNMCLNEIHSIGWCSSRDKPLFPPSSLQHKYPSFWRNVFADSLVGSSTLPEDFESKLEDAVNRSTLRERMKLEVVDKSHLSAVRVAVVSKVVGRRIHVLYSDYEDDDDGFWCHELSPLVHPVGWAQIIGHDIIATSEYTKRSLENALLREHDPDEVTWDMFKPLPIPKTDLKFKEGMKIEAIDPLNLSAICVATVVKVLRNNYLMIGIDGMMVGSGSDCFCYHSSSPYIFPVGFCEDNGIDLTPPLNFGDGFNWEKYLEETDCVAAPAELFEREIPDHGFSVGMYLEAVDLMEPRFICVGVITRVVGRLLRVHFDGWQEDYDQWCDCESPDLFPIGWCQIYGYCLEPPHSEPSEQPEAYELRSSISRKKRQSCVLSISAARGCKGGKKKIHRKIDKQPKPSNDDAQKNFEKKFENSLPAVKCAQKGTEPSKWTAADVSQFLELNDCALYSRIFLDENVDGSAFLDLTRERLMCLTGMKLGPSLKMFHMIQQLKKK